MARQAPGNTRYYVLFRLRITGVFRLRSKLEHRFSLVLEIWVGKRLIVDLTRPPKCIVRAELRQLLLFFTSVAPDHHSALLRVRSY